MVVRLLTEGLGIRAASRLAGVDQKTVLNILETTGRACAELLDQKLLNLKPEPIEIDECWTMVSNKRRKGNTATTGDFYAFLASGKESKLICSYFVGKRDHQTGEDFMGEVRTRNQSPLQLTSDGWVGFIQGVFRNRRDDLHYAVQVKKYEGYNVPIDGGKRRYGPGKCVSVTGTPTLFPMRGWLPRGVASLPMTPGSA